VPVSVIDLIENATRGITAASKLPTTFTGNAKPAAVEGGDTRHGLGRKGSLLMMICYSACGIAGSCSHCFPRISSQPPHGRRPMPPTPRGVDGGTTTNYTHNKNALFGAATARWGSAFIMLRL
jgi:hypothetical protein